MTVAGKLHAANLRKGIESNVAPHDVQHLIDRTLHGHWPGTFKLSCSSGIQVARKRQAGPLANGIAGEPTGPGRGRIKLAGEIECARDLRRSKGCGRVNLAVRQAQVPAEDGPFDRAASHLRRGQSRRTQSEVVVRSCCQQCGVGSQVVQRFRVVAVDRQDEIVLDSEGLRFWSSADDRGLTVR